MLGRVQGSDPMILGGGERRGKNRFVHGFGEMLHHAGRSQCVLTFCAEHDQRPECAALG